LEHLSNGHEILNNEEIGIQTLLAQCKQSFSKLAGYGSAYASLFERIQSVFVEVDDIRSEIETLQEQVTPNPGLLEEVNEKLQLLYNLQKKHNAATVGELIEIKDQLEEKLSKSEDLEQQIEAQQALIRTTQKELTSLASELSERRIAVVPELKDKLESSLQSLGMPNATFNMQFEKSESFLSSGRDLLIFEFSANRGSSFGSLKKVASGGELSRIMLIIKSVLASYEQLPTMMFDEIDTGVSGEISNNMGDIMQQMSANMQVFSITHLPQVASKGDHHYKVFKEDDGEVTRTRMKKLSSEERVVELAEMLGGKALSDSAMAHAKQLLN
jgi:DNA repair protein RecN (Recombination protein N)